MSDDNYKKELLHTLIRPSENELIVDINPYSKELMHNTFFLTSTQYLDLEWLKESIEYTKQLPIHLKFTLRSYTSNGDTLINKYLRENKIIHTSQIVFATQLFKMYDTISDIYYNNDLDLSEEGKIKANQIMVQYKLDILNDDVNIIRLKSIIDMYINDLRNILIDAPKCAKDFIVFRGVDDDYIHDTSKWIKLKGFQSTSYFVDLAITFRKAALYEIVVSKFTPCVVMDYVSAHSHEKEILLCDNLFIKAGDIDQKYTLDSIHLYVEDDKYTEWKYLLDKIIDPSNDIEENNIINNNSLLTPKQIETYRRLYCSISDNIQAGGYKLSRKINKNKTNKSKTRKNKMCTNNIVCVGDEDIKSRFKDPILIDKTYDRLPPKFEIEFYQFILNNGGQAQAYLKELYPGIKKQT